MPITANANYLNPQMGQIVGNLATAIYGDPDARMKAGYYGAQANSANATAAKTNAETTGINTQNDAMQKVGSIGQIFMRRPGETPGDYQTRVAPAYGTILQAGGGNADALARGLNSVIANVFSQGDVDDQARSLTMQGKPVDQNFSPTVARADAVAGRNAGYARQQAEGVANINQTGETTRNTANNNAKLGEIFSAPVVSKPGDTIYLAPNDPRAKTIGTNGVVKGAPTVDTVRAAAGEKIAALPDGQAPSSNISDVFSGKSGVAAKPKAVNAKALQSAIVTGVKSLKGVVDSTDPQRSMENFTSFEASFPPEKIAAAHDAANQILASTGNANDAGAAYLAALGLKPGDVFQQPGMLGRLFGGAPRMESADSAAVAVPVTRDQIPPPEQRKPGSVWNTPKGQMTWTGQGWVPAGKTY